MSKWCCFRPPIDRLPPVKESGAVQEEGQDAPGVQATGYSLPQGKPATPKAEFGSDVSLEGISILHCVHVEGCDILYASDNLQASTVRTLLGRVNWNQAQKCADSDFLIRLLGAENAQAAVTAILHGVPFAAVVEHELELEQQTEDVTNKATPAPKSSNHAFAPFCNAHLHRHGVTSQHIPMGTAHRSEAGRAGASMLAQLKAGKRQACLSLGERKVNTGDPWQHISMAQQVKTQQEEQQQQPAAESEVQSTPQLKGLPGTADLHPQPSPASLLMSLPTTSAPPRFLPLQQSTLLSPVAEVASSHCSSSHASVLHGSSTSNAVIALPPVQQCQQPSMEYLYFQDPGNNHNPSTARVSPISMGTSSTYFSSNSALKARGSANKEYFPISAEKEREEGCNLGQPPDLPRTGSKSFSLTRGSPPSAMPPLQVPAFSRTSLVVEGECSGNEAARSLWRSSSPRAKTLQLSNAALKRLRAGNASPRDLPLIRTSFAGVNSGSYDRTLALLELLSNSPQGSSSRSLPSNLPWQGYLEHYMEQLTSVQDHAGNRAAKDSLSETSDQPKTGSGQKQEAGQTCSGSDMHSGHTTVRDLEGIAEERHAATSNMANSSDSSKQGCIGHHSNQDGAPSKASFEVTLRPLPVHPDRRPMAMVSFTDVTEQLQVQAALLSLAEGQLALLSSLLPQHAIEFLARQDSAPALPQDKGYLASSHQNVTLMFMDIVGFTTWAKGVEPKDVMALLNTLFSRLDHLTDQFQVHKVETAGDCYIVSCGILNAETHNGFFSVLENHTDPAASARKVMEYSKALLTVASQVHMPNSDKPVTVRVGMHTGDVVSGLIGSKLPAFKLFGDTMNSASRMESNSLPGCIHVSEATYKLLPEYAWKATGGLEIKGKGIMQTYFWDPTVNDGFSSPFKAAQHQQLAERSTSLLNSISKPSFSSSGLQDNIWNSNSSLSESCKIAVVAMGSLAASREAITRD